MEQDKDDIPAWFVSGIESALSAALESEFGIAAQAAREQAAVDREESRLLDEQRASMQQSTAIALASIGMEHSTTMHDATARYVDAALCACDRAFKVDPRMPRTLNADERYSAMKTLSSVESLLNRIEQTIDDAQVIIERVPDIDIQGVIIDSSTMLLNLLEPLAHITVGEAGVPIGELLAEVISVDQEERETEDESQDSIEALVREAFVEAYGDASLIDTDYAKRSDWREKEEEKINAAIDRALVAVEKHYRRVAESCVGRAVFEEMPPRFEMTAEPGLIQKVNFGLVMRLLEEVRKAFDTYKRCLEDNGIFCAFPDHGRFGGVGSRSKGICGYMGWSGGMSNKSRYQTRNVAPLPKAVRRVASIPDVIENQCDDTIEEAITRMEEYNARPYWGPLDDDPSAVVDQFWYGFKELMVFVNSMFDVDLHDYVLYTVKAHNLLVSQAAKIGYSMDAVQVEQVEEELGRLQRTLEVE